MRKKATKEDWNAFYALAQRYRERKPWRKFYDSDFFCIRFSPGEAGYFTMLGMAGECYGLSLYMGEEGFEQLIAMQCQEMLNLPADYLMREQTCVAMYIEDEERAFSKELITIQAYEKGYFPYQPDREQVREFTRYLERLLQALDYYEREQCNVNFREGFLFEYYLEDGSWKGRSVDIKDRGYDNLSLILSDPEQIEALKKAAEKKTDCVLEMDFFYGDITVGDAENGKQMNPRITVAIDQESGDLVAVHVLNQEEDEKVVLASMLAQWITENGAPKQVMISNSLTEAALKSLCENTGIPLEMGILEGVEEFRQSMDEEEEEDGLDAIDVEEFFGEDGLLKMLSDLGMDPDELKEKAATMTEKEFRDNLSGRLAALMEQAGFSGDELDGPFGEDEEVYESEQLSGRRRKSGAVREFFAQDSGFREEPGKVMITCSERSRRECLMEGSKEELSKLAAGLGVHVKSNYNKAMLAGAIIDSESLGPDALRDYIGEETAALLEFLRGEAEPDEDHILEMELFPYSMEAVMKLLSLGLIDIGRGWKGYEEILEIYLVTDE